LDNFFSKAVGNEKKGDAAICGVKACGERGKQAEEEKVLEQPGEGDRRKACPPGSARSRREVS
jgi:hypothetical protein